MGACEQLGKHQLIFSDTTRPETHTSPGNTVKRWLKCPFLNLSLNAPDEKSVSLQMSRTPMADMAICRWARSNTPRRTPRHGRPSEGAALAPHKGNPSALPAARDAARAQAEMRGHPLLTAQGHLVL